MVVDYHTSEQLFKTLLRWLSCQTSENKIKTFYQLHGLNQLPTCVTKNVVNQLCTKNLNLWNTLVDNVKKWKINHLEEYHNAKSIYARFLIIIVSAKKQWWQYCIVTNVFRQVNVKYLSLHFQFSVLWNSSSKWTVYS